METESLRFYCSSLDQVKWEALLPAFASPSPYQDCDGAPWFLPALVPAIAVSQAPFPFLLLSP